MPSVSRTCKPRMIFSRPEAMPAAACRAAAAILVVLAAACGDGGDGQSCMTGTTDCDGRCVNLRSDPSNCGSCGNVCTEPPNAAGACIEEVCGYSCDPGYTDLDGSAVSGCEYQCRATDREWCNGQDDDCDGTKDNGETDGVPWDCVQGDEIGCRTACDDAGEETGTAVCPDTCYREDITECVPPEEVCNGEDDDCNDSIDDGSTAGVGWTCVYGTELSCTIDCGEESIIGTGQCPATCMSRDVTDCSPPPEVCNGLDDDCNGVADDGETAGVPWDCVMDADTMCSTACDPPGERTGTGTCPDTCLADDVDPCEPPAAEACNGRDDNCDGDVDEGVFGKLLGESIVSANEGTDVNRPDIVWTVGSGFFIAWDENPADLWEIKSNNVDLSGIRSSTSPASLPSGSEVHGDRIMPALAYDDADRRVGAVWMEDIGTDPVVDLRVFFVSSDARGWDKRPVDNARVDPADAQGYDPHIVWVVDRTAYAIVWVSDEASVQSVKFSLTTNDGVSSGEPTAVGTLEGSKADPRVAWSGSRFAVVWTDDYTGNREIFASILDGSGAPVAGEENIRLHSMLTEVETRALVWDGVNFCALVLGRLSGGERKMHLMVMDDAGGLLGAVELPGTVAATVAADLSWDGSLLGMAWDEGETSASRIHFRRISGGSAAIEDYFALAPDIDVTTLAGASWKPALTWVASASVYGLAFVNDRSSTQDDAEVFMTTLGCL